MAIYTLTYPDISRFSQNLINQMTVHQIRTMQELLLKIASFNRIIHMSNSLAAIPGSSGT